MYAFIRIAHNVKNLRVEFIVLDNNLIFAQNFFCACDKQA